jgi:hypothetical protein
MVRVRGLAYSLKKIALKRPIGKAKIPAPTVIINVLVTRGITP